MTPAEPGPEAQQIGPAAVHPVGRGEVSMRTAGVLNMSEHIKFNIH